MRLFPRLAYPVLACALLAALPVAAQGQAPSAVAANATLLSLNAEGRATRVPDLAVFSASVVTQAATATDALAENARKMDAVIASLKQAGIAARDIQTSNLALTPVERPRQRLPDGTYEEGPPQIIAYRVNNSVTVRQRKLKDYGKVIDVLVKSGANQINGPDFRIADSSSAMDEARRNAMKVARDRANLYAEASGLRVVRVLSISESGSMAPRPVMYARMADVMASPAPATPVEAGELDLSVNLAVQFELAP